MGENVPLVTTPISEPAWSVTLKSWRGILSSMMIPRLIFAGPCCMSVANLGHPTYDCLSFETTQPRSASNGLFDSSMSEP